MIETKKDPELCNTFADAVNRNSAVYRVLKAGGTLEDVIVNLVNIQDELFRQVCALHDIAPKAIRAKDGKVTVWHCPDHLIPVTAISDF